MLGRLVAVAVLRPVTTVIVTIAVMVFGWVAATRLPVDLLPDLSYPSLTVKTTYPDAAPIEVEELATRPIEELVSAVPGVIRVESISREGESEVVLDFAWGTGMDAAMADVREKLDRVVLPRTAARPIVLRYDPAGEPILRLGLRAPAGSTASDLSTLRRKAELAIKRPLEKIDGVAAVQLHGGRDDEILVELDPDRLRALHLDSTDVVTAITRDNVNRPGGALTDHGSRYLIRTLHEARTPEQLGAVIVRAASGAELRLRDLATVRRASPEPEEWALLGGDPAVELSVHREGDANTVDVVHRIREEIDRLALPGGLELVILSNQAEFIEAAVAEVEDNTLLGGALAVLVLLFFLRDLRATLVIGVAIPISLLATFVPLHMLGSSLNLMSLGGLALGVGMLVDNSIVVLEAIARKHEQADPGTSRRQNAVAGTTEVAAAVVASTLTTVAVFLPMAFVEGVAGQLVRDLSYAVSFSILSSMLVSLTLVPVLLAIGDETPDEGEPAPRSWIAWIAIVPALLWRGVRALVRLLGRGLRLLATPIASAYEAIERVYPRALAPALRHPRLVLLATTIACGLALLSASSLGRTLLPEVRQGEFWVQIVLPQGTALERTAGVARALNLAVEGDERVEVVFARIGNVLQTGSASGSLRGTHLGQVGVRLRPDVADEDGAVERELFERIRVANPDADAELRFGRPQLLSFDAPIEVRVFAEDLGKAMTWARDLLPALRETPGLSDVVPDDLNGRPEVRVRFDRERLGRLGLDVERAATAVQRSIQGELATKLFAPDRQLDIRVQLPRVDRSRVEDVAAIQVGVVAETPVLLRAVADVQGGIGPAEIRRIDGRRGLRIQTRVEGADLGGIAAAVEEVLAAHADPSGAITAVVSGQAEEMERSLDSLMLAAALSVFLVYVVMASSFESLLHPFLIMFSVPLSTVGVMLACAALRIPLSAMVGIGAIILAGIVVNNAIVLVDAVNQRRGAGIEVEPALIDAARTRIRPIVMTTITTVLGLAPMALGLGEGAALRQPLAVAVISGLSLSTLLTLVVIPCAYRLFPGKRRDAWGTSAPVAADPEPDDDLD